MKIRRRVGTVLLIASLPLSILGYLKREHLGNYVLRLREKLNQNSEAFPIYYVSSSHNRTPNPSVLVIPKEEDLSLLNDVLDTIFPTGTDGLSEEEKSIAILKYAASAFSLKANKGSATKMIKDGYTLCGGMASVFVMLSRAVGLPARPAVAKYMPSFSEHVVSEVFYAGRWHMFDPTYGIFFYSRPDYDKDGYVISFHEFLTRPDECTPFKVVSRPWAGTYDQGARTFGVTRVEGDYLKEKYGESVISVYKKEMQDAFPVGFGGSDLVSYPVDANLLEDTDQWFGENNNSYDDLALFTKEYAGRYKASFFGSYYLGEFAIPAFHTWVIRAPVKSSITIEYYCADDSSPKLELVALRAVQLVESSHEDRKTTFTLHTNDGEAILSVYCPEGTFFVDAMHIFRR
jgi:hypothetical protein